MGEAGVRTSISEFLEGENPSWSSPPSKAMSAGSRIRTPRRRSRPGCGTTSPAYKVRVLQEHEALDKFGKGALLRRDGLYSPLIPERRRNETAVVRPDAARSGAARRPILAIERWPGCTSQMAKLPLELDKAKKVIAVQVKTFGALGGARSRERGERAAVVGDVTATELAPLVGTKGARQVVSRARATSWLHAEPPAPKPTGTRPSQPVR